MGNYIETIQPQYQSNFYQMTGLYFCKSHVCFEKQ